MRVVSGNPSTITWHASHVTSCEVSDSSSSGFIVSGNEGKVNNKSPITPTITGQTTFTIKCQAPNYDDIIRWVTVNVTTLFQEF